MEARILQSAHAELSLKERINPNEITLTKTMVKITGLCLVCVQRIGNVTKYLCCHLHSVQYPKNI